MAQEETGGDKRHATNRWGGVVRTGFMPGEREGAPPPTYRNVSPLINCAGCYGKLFAAINWSAKAGAKALEVIDMGEHFCYAPPPPVGTLSLGGVFGRWIIKRFGLGDLADSRPNSRVHVMSPLTRLIPRPPYGETKGQV